MLASLVAGLLAFTLYGVAMVLMKVGAPALASPRRALVEPALRRLLVAWGFGVAANFGFAALLGVALGLGHASVVAALNGFGLVVVAVLSRVLLGERLDGAKNAGIGLVVVGVVLIGLLAPPPGAAPAVDVSLASSLSGAVLGLCLIAGLATLVRRGLGGPLLGIAAGALGGLAILLQKIFVGPLMAGGRDVVTLGWELVTSGWFWAWSASATGSFVVLQVAYRFGDATVVAPTMVSAMILVPQGGGVLLFGESLAGGQVVGTLLVLAGVVLLTAFSGGSDPAARDVEGRRP